MRLSWAAAAAAAQVVWVDVYGAGAWLGRARAEQGWIVLHNVALPSRLILRAVSALGQRLRLEQSPSVLVC